MRRWGMPLVGIAAIVAFSVMIIEGGIRLAFAIRPALQTVLPVPVKNGIYAANIDSRSFLERPGPNADELIKNERGDSIGSFRES